MRRVKLHGSFTPSVVSHNVGICVCEKGTHYPRRVFTAPLGVRRPLVTDGAATGVCEKGKHWEEALQLLQEMFHTSRTHPTWHATVQPSARARRASICKEALRLLQKLLHRSLAPDVVSYSAMASACEKGKHWEEAL